LFPEQGQWTEGAYLALNTRRMIELSDGCLEVLPVPTIFHLDRRPRASAHHSADAGRPVASMA
jgi:hypothetical protein